MIDKTQFLAKRNETRYYLQKPWLADNKTCYCNGHVLLIEDGVQPGVEPIPIPFAIEKFTTAIANAHFEKQHWPEIPEKHTCGECDGTGKDHKTECPECEGEGDVFFENEHNRYTPMCLTCNGSGYIKKLQDSAPTCQRCNGSGKTWQAHDHVNVHGMNINLNYANLIMHDPNVEIAVDRQLYALLFKSGPLSGAILGIRL